MTCSISGCVKPKYQKGFCCSHYSRWYRYGDPLAGGTAKGAALQYLMQHMHDDCPKWPFARLNNGYAVIRRKKKTVLVSRIVCEMICGPAPTPAHEAAHLCGKGHEGCFGAHCLVWKTRPENNADKLSHGTLLFGERAPWSKLTDEDVRLIKRRIASGDLQKNIAADYGVRRQTIGDIALGRNWAHLKAEAV